MPNPYLYKLPVLSQTIQLSMSTQVNRPKTFLYQAIQFSQTVLIKTTLFSIRVVFVYTQFNIKTVLFQTFQFSIGTQFKCQNCSILNNRVFIQINSSILNAV